MKSKSKNQERNIYYAFFVLLLIIIFLMSCSWTGVFKLKENFKGKYLYKTRYTCDNPNHIPASTPEICCTMKHGRFSCDNMRNCKCKNKDTGVCEVCYDKINIKKNTIMKKTR